MIQPCLFIFRTLALWLLGHRYGTPKELTTVMRASYVIPAAEFQGYPGCLEALCSAAWRSQINSCDIPQGAGCTRWLTLVINYLSPVQCDLIADLFQERQAVAECVPLVNRVEWLPPQEVPSQHALDIFE